VEEVIRIEVLLLFLLLGTNFARSQEQLPELGFPIANATQTTRVKTVRGIVVEEHGAVIPKAEIALQRVRAGGTVGIAKTETDSEGRFQLSATKGRYQVVVRALGFKDERLPIEISPKGIAGFKVEMKVGTVVFVN
jgi:Carboxypeptidase regulatory-like domain